VVVIVVACGGGGVYAENVFIGWTGMVIDGVMPPLPGL
jgi:hypothetical protein